MTLPVDADSVYFLMFDGWKSELRSNRWHYAKRFARQVPTTLVQPTQPYVGRKYSRPEPRIANCRIAWVRRTDAAETFVRDGIEQAAQILADMEACGFRRPLFWCYNPMLLGPYCLIPAAARVIHATENYFDLTGIDPFLRDAYRRAIKASDQAIAVSEGVARSIKREADTPVAVVTNGCDFDAYVGTDVDEGLMAARGGFQRVAVYAGNVNDRLDYALLHRTASSLPNTLFAIYGPVRNTSTSAAVGWRRLTELPNVAAFGEVPPDRLPAIYRAADVGLLPYRDEEPLATSGFPLKTLEMAATGLPVVSTRLDPLKELARSILVTESATNFVTAAATTSRAQLSAADRIQLVAIAQSNDYDRKFAAALQAIRSSKSGSALSTRADVVAAGYPDGWRSALRRAGGWTPARYAAGVARTNCERLVTSKLAFLRRAVPRPFRRFVARQLFRT